MNLSKRLRQAAIERAAAQGDQFDGCILTTDGVIDLRVSAFIDESEAATPSPPELPRIGPARIDRLYDRSSDSTIIRQRWRGGQSANDNKQG